MVCFIDGAGSEIRDEQLPSANNLLWYCKRDCEQPCHAEVLMPFFLTYKNAHANTLNFSAPLCSGYRKT